MRSLPSMLFRTGAVLAAASICLTGCIALPAAEPVFDERALELPEVTPRLSAEFVSEATAGAGPVPAGQALDEELELLGSDVDPEECENLLLLRPILLTDGSSDDPVASIDVWRSDVGSTLEGYGRLFDSPAQAADLLRARDGLVEACAAGYAGEGFQATSIERIASERVQAPEFAAEGADVRIVAWREVGFSGTDGDTEDYTFLGVDLRRENMVVRGNCLLLSIDTEFEESCLEYFGSLVRRLELLEPGA